MTARYLDGDPIDNAERLLAGLLAGRKPYDPMRRGHLADLEVALAEVRVAARVCEEAVAIMRDARGHYGIEEAGGPGQPATEWDEIADRMQAFVHRYGGAS